MAWKKTDLLERGKLNPKQVLRCLLDLDKRITALENGSNQQQEPQQQEQQQEQEQTPTTRDLSFTINDGTDPIEGATVSIGAKTGTTGSAGGCTISGVEEGSQSVEVSATGYTTKTETISVDETHTSFTISLVAEQGSP